MESRMEKEDLCLCLAEVKRIFGFFIEKGNG